MADQVGPLASDGATDQSAQAVADDNNPAARIFRDFLEARHRALNLALRASDIDAGSYEGTSVVEKIIFRRV